MDSLKKSGERDEIAQHLDRHETLAGTPPV